MPFAPLPRTAAWLHLEARSGFEVAWFQLLDDGYRISGCTAAVEDAKAWTIDYDLRVDPTWTTRRAVISRRPSSRSEPTVLETDGLGRWLVDGKPAPHLDGCLDVDLESSAMTNALPVHRMDLPPSARATAPAAYVRVVDLSVGRLEQDYVRTSDQDSHHRYDYAAPAFDFACRLSYDEAGLVLAYPGIAVRSA